MKKKNFGTIRKLMVVALSVCLMAAFMPAMSGGAAFVMAASHSKPAKVKWYSGATTQTTITLKWKKASNADGYAVYMKKGSKYKVIKLLRTRSYKITKLKAYTSYRFYVKAYNKVGKKRIYGKASVVKKLKTKAATVAGVTVSDQTAASGGTATFTARIARGTAPYKYQWYREGQAVSGATAASYTTPAVTFSDNGTKYFCRVTGINGKYADSNTAMLRVEKAVVKSWNIGAASAGVYYDGTSQGNSNAVATLYEDGTLALTGTGNIMEYDINAYILPPWCTGEYASKVTGYTIAPTLTVRSMSLMFNECTNLTRASVIPAGVTTMEDTFWGCSSLTEIASIPEGVTSMSGAFGACTSLKTAPVLPASLTDMSGCFNGCTALETAPAIPGMVKDMSAAFNNCTALKTAPVIPASVEIMRNTFYGCESLETAARIDGAPMMENTYSGCSALKTVPDIPEGVENLSGAFAGCSALKEAPRIPSSVTNMYNTFIGCASLQKAPIIPEKVTNMEGTFSGCFSLITASTIPASVTNLMNVYSNCPALTGTILIKADTSAAYNNMLQGSVLIPGASLKVNYTSQNQLIITGLMQPPYNSNSNITAAGTYVDIADQQISGGGARFTASTAPGSYTYQWSVRYAGESSFTDITGAITDTLSMNGLTDAQKGNVYRCTVTDTSKANATAYGEAKLY